MAQQQGNSLETMMMAYADLSGSGRGSSFKGPPLKEVKVNKQPAPAFTTSSKARDWTSLEQALEDAFTIAPSPASTAATTVDLTTSASFSTFSHWQDPGPTVQPVYQPPQAARQQSVDDWGDFQDFQKVSVTAEPQVTIQPKPVIEDDDFADFVTASGPPLPPPQQQQQQPVRHQLVNPVIHQQLTNPSFPQLPSSYSHPNPLTSQQPPSVNQPTPLLSNTVGLRLASFQEESPVHNFRTTTKDPVRTTSDSPSRFEPFFGGADDDTFQFEISSSSASASLPTVAPSFTPFSQPLDSFPAMPITSGILPTPIAPSNDKYGALSDLLSLSELDASSFSLSSTSTNQIFEPTFPSATTDSASTFPTNFSNSLMSNESQVKTPTIFQPNLNLANKRSNDDEEEDFGDFITVPSGQNTTTSKPSSTFTTSFPGFATTSPTNVDVMSWHDDGPPPMPADDEDENNDEDFDEFNSSTNSGIVTADDLVISDGNFFQQKTQDTSQTVNSMPPQYSSPPDSLSLNSFEDSQAQQSNTDSSSPQIESIPQQPNKNSNQIRTFEPPCLDRLKSPYREWSQALTQIFEILSSGADTFSNISDDAILDEVLESNEGSNYLKNVIEIYRVFKRIQLSYSMAVWNDAVQSQCEETEKAWKGLLVNLKSKASSIIPNRAVFDFSNCVVATNNATSETVCSLCLLSITGHSKDVSQVVRESVCNYDQKKYHSTCANFWLNCVDLRLPKLI